MLRTRPKTASELGQAHVEANAVLAKTVERVALEPMIKVVERVSRAAGRPASGKEVVTLRLSPDVIAKFRATGKGWQARIDEALRKANV